MVDELVDEFKANLRRIAFRTAYHDRVNTVHEKHVRQTFEHLVRCGLDQTPWYKRPQLKITGAATAMAVMLAVPDFTPVFFPDDRQKSIVIGTMIVCGLFALSLYAWGWSQNRM